MKKILFLSFLTINIFFSFSGVWGADWRTFGSSDNAFYFYDEEGITRASQDIVTVWMKAIFTEKGIKEAAEKYGEDYENFSHSIELYKINCKDKIYCILSINHYAKEGTVILSDSRSDTEYLPIIPESVSEGLYQIVCKPAQRYGIISPRL